MDILDAGGGVSQKDVASSYVCPSDRQLTLRGRLCTGWSQPKGNPISNEEHELIVSVIKRNEAVEKAERIRVGKLVDKLEKIKERINENGINSSSHCRLCGQLFRFLRSPRVTCEDCQSSVCQKCAVELHVRRRHSHGVQTLCQVCSLTREIWKKSGAWFYRGFPQYELPEKPTASGTTTKRGTSFIRKATASIRLNDDDSSSNSSSSGGSEAGPGRSSSHCSFDEDDELKDSAEVGSLCSRKFAASSDACPVPPSSIIRHCSRDSIREPPIGWLEVDLAYVVAEETLRCTVSRARDLRAMDAHGLTDSFCKLNLVGVDGVCRLANWSRTKTVHKTRNPEFNETISFAGINADALKKSILYVVVLDDDKYGHDFLGAARICLMERHMQRVSAPLVKEDAIASLAVNEGPWSRGRIQLSLCYNTRKRALHVLIKECSNLISMDSNGYSDPFVKIQLKPDGHRKKYRTNIKWRNLNPIFNEEFLFETRPNDMDKQSLLLTVWDKDLGKSNDFLGSLVLSGASKGRRLKQWRDCIRLPDQWHTQWHSLSSEQNH